VCVCVCGQVTHRWSSRCLWASSAAGSPRARRQRCCRTAGPPRSPGGTTASQTSPSWEERGDVTRTRTHWMASSRCVLKLRRHAREAYCLVFVDSLLRLNLHSFEDISPFQHHVVPGFNSVQRILVHGVRHDTLRPNKPSGRFGVTFRYFGFNRKHHTNTKWRQNTVKSISTC